MYLIGLILFGISNIKDKKMKMTINSHLEIWQIHNFSPEIQ